MRADDGDDQETLIASDRVESSTAEAERLEQMSRLPRSKKPPKDGDSTGRTYFLRILIIFIRWVLIVLPLFIYLFGWLGLLLWLLICLTLSIIVALHDNGDSMKNFKKTLFHDLDIDTRIIFIQGPLNYLSGHAWPISGAALERYGDSLAEVVGQFSQIPKPSKAHPHWILRGRLHGLLPGRSPSGSPTDRPLY